MHGQQNINIQNFTWLQNATSLLLKYVSEAGNTYVNIRDRHAVCFGACALALACVSILYCPTDVKEIRFEGNTF